MPVDFEPLNSKTRPHNIEVMATSSKPLMQYPSRRERKRNTRQGVPESENSLVGVAILTLICVMAFLAYAFGSRLAATGLLSHGSIGSLRGSATRLAASLRPPSLHVYQPEESSTIRGSTLKIAGWTDPGAKVKAEILGSEHPISNMGGQFEGDIPLPSRAVDSVRVIAMNEAGKVTEETIHLRDPASRVPEGYYETKVYGSYENNFSGLQRFLRAFKLPRGYETEVFDCSESAAMLEWALQTAGFDAYIVAGPTPWENTPTSRHAWVIVHISASHLQGVQDYAVAIEPTALTGGLSRTLLNLWAWLKGETYGVIYSNNPYSGNYYGRYDHKFKDIYEAARVYGSLDQWNWWEGNWGFR